MITLEEDWGVVAAAPSSERRRVPWEDPEVSAWVGFYRTLRDLFLSPGEFFENLGPGGWTESVAFALIVSTAGLLFTLFWHLLILAGDTSGPTAYLDTGPGALVGLMMAAPLLALIDLGVGGLCWWGSVALSGACREFTPAWRIFCYAHGGLVLALIPILGSMVAGIWILALLYIGAKKAFGISALSSLGVLVIFLVFQAILGIMLVLCVVVGLAGLGLLTLLG